MLVPVIIAAAALVLVALVVFLCCCFSRKPSQGRQKKQISAPKLRQNGQQRYLLPHRCITAHAGTTHYTDNGRLHSVVFEGGTKSGQHTGSSADSGVFTTTAGGAAARGSSGSSPTDSSQLTGSNGPITGHPPYRWVVQQCARLCACASQYRASAAE